MLLFTIFAAMAMVGLGALGLLVTLIIVAVRHSGSGARIRVRSRYFDQAAPVMNLMHLSQNVMDQQLELHRQQQRQLLIQNRIIQQQVWNTTHRA